MQFDFALRLSAKPGRHSTPGEFESMGVVTLFVLFLVGVLIVLPVWTLIAISNVRRENRDLARRLSELENRSSGRVSPGLPPVIASPHPSVVVDPSSPPPPPPLQPPGPAPVPARPSLTPQAPA
ncbi:MAG TPA: hypothetical protein PKX00_25175, partial [Opitutaceae bacterium]|nr:hypothetical protein [Opitutaceae bacterium]